MIRRFTAILLGLFFAALPLQAQGVMGFIQSFDWFVRGSILFFPENNKNASAPMHILPSLGGGASRPLNDYISLEVSLDLYGTTYDYDYNLKRVVPANAEFRSASVMGILVGVQPVYRLTLREKFTIRAYGGLGLDIRMVFRASGIKDTEDHQIQGTVGQARKEITSYFWGGGRFLFPFVGVGVDYPIMEGIQLGLDFRFWYPVWKIWTGENLPTVEGLRFGVGFRVSF